MWTGGFAVLWGGGLRIVECFFAAFLAERLQRALDSGVGEQGWWETVSSKILRTIVL